MSFFFDGPNRARPGMDLHSSPTGYQERSRGGPDGERTVVGMVTWPMGVMQRYMNAATVSISDGTMKGYLEYVPLMDSFTARNGVQSKTIQVEPGQNVLMKYRSGGSTTPVITGAMSLMGEIAPFVEEGVMYGIDDTTSYLDLTPMPTTHLPSVVNNDWMGTWHIPPMRGLREIDPLNGNEAQASIIPGPLVELVDRFGNVSDILYGEARSNHFGDDDFTQGHLDGIADRAILNAEQSVRHAVNNLALTENWRSSHSNKRFRKGNKKLDLITDWSWYTQGQEGAMQLLDTALEQLEEANEVAETHLKWMDEFPQYYINRIVGHWGRLGGTGINVVADHLPPPLLYAERAIFGGYDIPPPIHSVIQQSINFAKGPGPNLSINRWELYKTASPLPIVSMAQRALAALGGGVGAEIAQLPSKPYVHVTVSGNDIDIAKRPGEALAVYMTALGVSHARHLVVAWQDYFLTHSLFDLTKALATAATNPLRLALAVVAVELGSPPQKVNEWLTFLLGREPSAIWQSILMDPQPRVRAKNELSIELLDSWDWATGVEERQHWLQDSGAEPFHLAAVEGDMLTYFLELAKRGCGRNLELVPKETTRLVHLIRRAFEIPVIGDQLFT